MRKRIATLWLIGVVGAVNWVSAVCGAEIISEPAALRHGLTRAWTAQVQVDAARGRVDSMVLDGGTLFVQTNQAVLEAIDAETGKRLWSREVGERGHPSMAPAMNARLVVVVNGSSLYVVNRYNGKLLLKIPLPAAPGAGPALSQQRAYVPMVNGTVVSYRLKPTADSLKEFGRVGKEGEVAPEEGPSLRPWGNPRALALFLIIGVFRRLSPITRPRLPAEEDPRRDNAPQSNPVAGHRRAEGVGWTHLQSTGGFAILKWPQSGGGNAALSVRNRHAPLCEGDPMIDPGLLELLVCPENRTGLHLAEESLVARLNEAVAEGKLKNKVGQPVRSRVDEGLIREDGTLLYPVVEGIPVLLIDEAIPLEQLE
jgi:uncharacterized protein YbaR (Trm112 family)